MLEPKEIKMILDDFLKKFENPEFIKFLEELDDYETVENFCEGMSLRIIEYTSNQNRKDRDGNKDNL